MDRIVPEDIVLQVEGYTPDHWNYPRRCADLDTALAATREQIEEWSADDDPHGYWHERPYLIALYNHAIRTTANVTDP